MPPAPRDRELLVALYDAAVAGAAPGPLTTAALRSMAPVAVRRTHLFALGKAAHAMAAAAVEWAGGAIAGGVIVAADAAPSPHAMLTSSVGDHPLPGARSLAAAARLSRAVANVGEHDTAVVLLSGGATSLLAAPTHALSSADLVRMFDLLHRSGLDIRSMNVVRKRFTQWGGGRLAAALATARTIVLVVSDVPGDDPADVASGPCAPDGATADDVLALLRASGLQPDVPPSLLEYLNAVRGGAIPETPKPGHPAFAGVHTRVIGSNALSVAAAVARARELGFPAAAGDAPLQGEAAACGDGLARALLERAERGQHGCIVWGGETTVRRTVSGEPTGPAPLGGRCQELALAAAKRLAGGGDTARLVTLLAAGTDGRDGPTDAAGAFADASVWGAIAQSGHDAEHALARHQSHAALDAAGALFRVPPTGTNVMDVAIGVVKQRSLPAR